MSSTSELKSTDNDQTNHPPKKSTDNDQTSHPPKKSTDNDQTSHPPNADPAFATVAATAAMAATRLAAERTTFVNPTSTRWAPMANRQTDIEYEMVNKRTSNK